MNAALDWLGGLICQDAACLGSGGGLLLVARLADGAVALSLFVVAAALLRTGSRRPELTAGRLLGSVALAFLLLSGFVHGLDALGLGGSWPQWRAVTQAILALVAAATAVLAWRWVAGQGRASTLAAHASSGAGADAAIAAGMNGRLRRDVAGHETAMHELEAARRDLETRVAERTRELSLVKARLETALRGAYVHAFSQDRDLRYTWVYDPDGPDAAAEMLGRTDQDILPACSRDVVVAAKRRVLETGRPETCEVNSVGPRARALFALHIEPAFGSDGHIEGLTGAAIDISRLRSLESEQQRLADELRTALQRYEIALRGSHVTLFTQDRDFRFTSISNPLFGREVDAIVGRTDADILPAESRAQFGALAREAIATGRAQGGEVSVKEADKTRWYDLHVEPLPDENGQVAGVTCALFDITDRKMGESHLRLLMRELTHRSKNLLAVIQSMARQTARHAGSIDDFLDAFGARLQAIATSHDLLVQEGWYGASLQDLTRRQLEKYIDGAAARVKLSGPPVRLKPAAAQSFGLALHELAMNAERFGALSVPQGRVEVVWRLQNVDGDSEQGVEIVWAEHGGPDVTAPISRGFGSLVVEKNLSRALDADVALTFEPAGVRCRMLIPASHLLAAR